MKMLISLVLIISISVGCKRIKHNQADSQVLKDKKNVVFILVDDMGWTDLASYGSTFYESPNIDRLAGQGIVFTSAYTPNPVCSPTRAAILTGRYPSRIGITDWIPGRDPKDRPLLGPEDLYELPLEEVTFAETLKEEGYKTFFAGKWHLGDDNFLPEDQGFDINKGGHHKGSPPGGYYSPYNNPKLTDGLEGEYLTDRLTNESISFLEKNKDDPFLLYLSFYTVHTPIEANKKHIAKFKAKQKKLKDSIAILEKEGSGQTLVNQYNPEYASMIYSLDENVGRLMKTLETLNLMEETLIIFTSDNGGLSTLDNNINFSSENFGLSTSKNNVIPPTSVKPLRAGKGWVYEGGIRVPLIIKKPGSQEHKTINAPVMSMDLFPTILDILDLPQKPELHKDGLSMNPLMNNEETELHKVLFWDYPHYHGSGWVPGQAVRKDDWKLVYFFENDVYELYNLKLDISEKNNLANNYPEKLEELKAELRILNKTLNTKKPKTNPLY
ncbi:sulfatase [Arenibacter sp. 6A1]|uniref:sulfatase n=1 Tax=Arenibacter sp. 6A1 TaxID=2720391 RepID=UPI0014457A60|nr:sulfatase [Arenibacter sp. 6A1]NKI28398.1 sulfatase [Arenibacter sp. 6A1]